MTNKLVDPMLAKKGDSSYLQDNWITERKFDGFRVIAIKRGNNVRLFSRNQKEYTHKFPDIVADLKKIDQNRVILDGEMVYLDKKGNDHFHMVQRRLQAKDNDKLKDYINRFPVKYFVFDILENDKWDRKMMKSLGLMLRKNHLQFVVRPSLKMKNVVYTDFFMTEKNKRNLVKQQKKLEREGVMHKSQISQYFEGRRSSDWRKHKFVNEADVMVVGYKLGTNRLSRSMGALYIAAYMKNRGITYLGKVGSGFSDDQRNMIKRMLNARIIKPDPYFLHDSGIKNKLHGPELKKIRWVKPIVIQVEYFEISRDNRLRFPVFMRMRPDKKPSQATI